MTESTLFRTTVSENRRLRLLAREAKYLSQEKRLRNIRDRVGAPKIAYFVNNKVYAPVGILISAGSMDKCEFFGNRMFVRKTK